MKMRLAGNKKTDQPKEIKMEGERDKEVAERLALSEEWRQPKMSRIETAPIRNKYHRKNFLEYRPDEGVGEVERILEMENSRVGEVEDMRRRRAIELTADWNRSISRVSNDDKDDSHSRQKKGKAAFHSSILLPFSPFSAEELQSAKPILEDDHLPEDMAKNPAKCWSNYIELSGCQPCIEPSLFRHVEWMNQTVLQRLCPPASILFVKQTNGGQSRPASIECCTGTRLLVSYLDVKKSEAEVINPDRILVDQDEWTACRKLAAANGTRLSYSTLVDIKLIKKYSSRLRVKLSDLIEKGQRFELQDVRDPTLTKICTIKSNVGGLVIYDSEANKYAPLEVLSATGRYFMYAYVMEVSDKYNFYIRYFDIYGEREMFCTRNSPNIFPVGYAASIKQDLLPPASIVGQEEREAFNWDTFRSTFLPENPPNSTVERKGPKLDPMQLIEVFNYDRGEMESALVVGGDKGIVRIVSAGAECLRPQMPRIVPNNSCELFPCGHASKFSMVAFKLFPPIKTLPKLNEGEERFELSKYYSSTPQPVFEHILVKLQRPSFLPEFYMKGDLFCPPIYINRLCDCGPYMQREYLMKSPYLIAYGPLPHVINDIVQTLISGAGDNAEKRQKLANAINQKNELHGPTQYVKLRMRTSHVSTRVAIPETAREMAGWMRHLLMCLHACPFLLSLDPRVKCPNICDRKEAMQQQIDMNNLKRRQQQQQQQQQQPTVQSPKKPLEKPPSSEKLRVKEPIKQQRAIPTKRMNSGELIQSPSLTAAAAAPSTSLQSPPTSISIDPPSSAPLPSPKIPAISPTTAAFLARMTSSMPNRQTALSNDKYMQKGNNKSKESEQKRRASDTGRLSIPASWRNTANTSHEMHTVPDSDDDTSNSNDAPKRLRLMFPSSAQNPQQQQQQQQAPSHRPFPSPSASSSAPTSAPVVLPHPQPNLLAARLNLPTVSSTSIASIQSVQESHSPAPPSRQSTNSPNPLTLPLYKPQQNSNSQNNSDSNKPSAS
ncbi:hypothetical protein WR25_25315 [Diploscapter pachys]|uniref:SLED domain-containing protein n=1 Tax=Diploscapter pachys TaxID=2018661 RepID=A0A2A2JEP2_9BILA|nr:hypothetical protein WR25_25315 [Diploscapter pachys]